MGHVIGDVIIDAATVDVASGVPVDISVGMLAGLGLGAMVEAVLSVVVNLVYKACITLFTSMMGVDDIVHSCLLYTSPSPRDGLLSRMPSSA